MSAACSVMFPIVLLCSHADAIVTLLEISRPMLLSHQPVHLQYADDCAAATQKVSQTHEVNHVLGSVWCASMGHNKLLIHKSGAR